MPPYHARTTTVAAKESGKKMLRNFRYKKPNKRRPPNRVTSIYADMRKSCREDLHHYYVCVMKHQTNGKLAQGSCDPEFAMVKECFRSVQKQTPIAK
mmetsp:Transcript_26076/g.38230  ORF Transcript_26076/g.38230 Transcript_26076/m.38230 type:complete len:97 (-) Transcript_26076:1302-1592(-)